MENKRWFALVLLVSICITYYGENFLKAAASALSPVLINELGINKGTMGLLISAFYEGLIDSTGSYFASNVVIIATSLIVTATMIFFTKETYGGLKKTN